MGSHGNFLRHSRDLVDLKSRSLGNIGAELGTELGHVVGKERGLAACAGDGAIPDAQVPRVRGDAGHRVCPYALGRPRKPDNRP